MIRRIRMREWRSYRDATLDFTSPVVFFVAPNGVSKTSVYEAARSCLFGFPKGRQAGRAVRGGADRAELSMDLSIGGATLAVTRTLTRGGRATFEALRDGERLDEDALVPLCRRHGRRIERCSSDSSSAISIHSAPTRCRSRSAGILLSCWESLPCWRPRPCCEPPKLQQPGA